MWKRRRKKTKSERALSAEEKEKQQSACILEKKKRNRSTQLALRVNGERSENGKREISGAPSNIQAWLTQVKREREKKNVLSVEKKKNKT